jgi:pyruvate formate lyase activating enzyme
LNGEVKGIVFGVQHFSLDDGPGIRTAVFLKGCNIACVWCHNPESMHMLPELMYAKAACTGCGACVQSCPNRARKINSVDRSKCDACGKCAELCLSGALSISGRWVTAGEIIDALRRDMRYYRSSGGGLTLTGGEPMCQPDFALTLARRSKEEGINVAMETNGLACCSDYQHILPYIDLFLIDYKLTGSEVHRKYTGTDGEAALKNIDSLCGKGARVVLRCPIIPGINDTEDHFQAIAELTNRYETVLGFELMPYHKLGAAKAERLGRVMDTYGEPDSDTAKKWGRQIINHGGKEWNKQWEKQ